MNIVLGQKIRQFRQDNGINQQEFAKEVGCTQELISMIENGKRSISEELMDIMVDAGVLDERQPTTKDTLIDMIHRLPESKCKAIIQIIKEM